MAKLQHVCCKWHRQFLYGTWHVGEGGVAFLFRQLREPVDLMARSSLHKVLVVISPF